MHSMIGLRCGNHPYDGEIWEKEKYLMFLLITTTYPAEFHRWGLGMVEMCPDLTTIS